MRAFIPFLTLAGLIISTSQISIPLTQNVNRCMVVYTSTPDENLILDIKFPSVPKQTSDEYYRVTIHNTEEKTSIEEKVTSGTYRK
jgi:hypothetical protein